MKSFWFLLLLFAFPACCIGSPPYHYACLANGGHSPSISDSFRKGCIAIAGRPSRWNDLGETADGLAYAFVDNQPKRAASGTLSTWVMYDLGASPSPFEVKIRSRLDEVRIDCGGQTYQLIQSIGYAGSQGEGDPTPFVLKLLEEPKRAPLGSVLESVIQRTCTLK